MSGLPCAPNENQCQVLPRAHVKSEVVKNWCQVLPFAPVKSEVA